jgi:hypothetical protein
MRDIVKILDSIYEWPIPKEKTIDVYVSLFDIFLFDGDENTMEYIEAVANYNESEKKEYRNRLAELGFELRPDEISQYLLIINMALKEFKEASDG